MREVAPGIWLDDTTGQYYDDQGNPITGDALNAALSGSSDTSGASGTAGGDVYTPPGVLDPDPTHAGHYPGQTPPWIAAGYPTFDAWSAAVGAGKAAQLALQEKQLNAAASSGSATLGAANISAQSAQQIEAQRAQNALDVQRLQNEVATAKTEADRQAAANALNEKYAELALAQKQEGFNEFTKLSDIASNPRNFMQTFFLHRGFQPPADSAGYGNGVNGLGAGRMVGSAAPAAPAAPQPSLPRGTLVNLPGSTTSQTNTATAPWAAGMNAGQPTTGDVGIGNGMFGKGTVFGVGEGGVPISLSPWAQQNLTNNNLAGAQTTAYAHGGITPEPIMGVGAHSNPAMFHALAQMPGHKYLMGERGPEGVVPAHYLPKFLQSRSGKEALPQHAPMGGDLASGDTQYGTNAGGMTSTYADGGALAAPPQGASGGDMIAMFALGGPLGMPSQAMQASMRNPLMGRTMDGGATGVSGDITAFADGGYLGTDGSTYSTPTTADTAMIGGVKVWAGGPYSGQPVSSTPANAGDLTPYLSNPNTPDPTGRVTQSFPSFSNTTSAPAAQTAQTSTGAPSGAPAAPTSGVANPYATTHTYTGNVSPYDQLNAAGAIPPFLSRLFGQAQGNQAVGTNTPQYAFLPPGLPLPSQLAYDQMSPSEQQALQSYASSYGIDPNDLLAQIAQQVAPARKRQNISYSGQ